jgi:hypothetical protein
MLEGDKCYLQKDSQVRRSWNTEVEYGTVFRSVLPAGSAVTGAKTPGRPRGAEKLVEKGIPGKGQRDSLCL